MANTKKDTEVCEPCEEGTCEKCICFDCDEEGQEECHCPECHYCTCPKCGYEHKI